MAISCRAMQWRAALNAHRANTTTTVYMTRAETRILFHEEKLWLELEVYLKATGVADEAIERQIARFGFDRDASSGPQHARLRSVRANCMDNVGKAVQAYKLLRVISTSRSHGAEIAHKAMLRTLRDLTVCYCLQQQPVPDRDTLLVMLNRAFEGQILRDKDLKSQLLHSYHHIMGTADGAFLSKSAKLTLARGWTRPRAARNVWNDYAVTLAKHYGWLHA